MQLGGGGLIFSQKHRAKLNGIERADSIVINPHKLLAVPQQCSLLLVKDKEILHQCHSKNAEYLFQRDKYYDKSFDLGDKYLQCGRKCDVFKFWFMWKAKVSKLRQKKYKNEQKNIYIFLNNFFVSFCGVF
jgi:glutamate/tyrosine decarboxylase-like PLP-dependent enzyme